MFGQDLTATLATDLHDPVVVVGEVGNEFVDRQRVNERPSFSVRVLAVSTMQSSSSVVIWRKRPPCSAKRLRRFDTFAGLQPTSAAIPAPVRAGSSHNRTIFAASCQVLCAGVSARPALKMSSFGAGQCDLDR